MAHAAPRGDREGDGLPTNVPVGVLSNDSDPDGEDDDDLTVNAIFPDPPSLGTAEITNDGSDILYTPDPNLCDDNTAQGTLTDTFRYNIIFTAISRLNFKIVIKFQVKVTIL